MIKYASVLRYSTDEGYKKALDHLKKCFGDEEEAVNHFEISCTQEFIEISEVKYALQKNLPDEEDFIRHFSSATKQSVSEYREKAAEVVRLLIWARRPD